MNVYEFLLLVLNFRLMLSPIALLQGLHFAFGHIKSAQKLAMESSRKVGLLVNNSILLRSDHAQLFLHLPEFPVRHLHVLVEAIASVVWYMVARHWRAAEPVQVAIDWDLEVQRLLVGVEVLLEVFHDDLGPPLLTADSWLRRPRPHLQEPIAGDSWLAH